MEFLMIFLLPLLVPFISKIFWKHTVCWKEMGVHIGIMLIFCTGIYFASMYSATMDTEIWSGSVSKKKKERVSCEHSYSCNCRQVSSGSGKNRTTTTVCDTCYDHSYDYDWAVYADYGQRVEIRRVDRQGTSEPKRWSEVNIGDPMSDTYTFTNYIKAAPDSLFNEQQYCTALPLPNYPDNIYDYYKIDRALSVGGGLKNPKEWSEKISQMMRKLGPQARANFVLVAVNSKDPRYAEDLRQKWLGGKKNDVILVLGMDQNLLQFARVVSWSENKMIHVDLREGIETAYKGKEIDADGVLAIADKSIRENFRRMKEENYEYLKDEIVPDMTTLIISFILALAASIGLTVFFHKNETF